MMIDVGALEFTGFRPVAPSHRLGPEPSSSVRPTQMNLVCVFHAICPQSSISKATSASVCRACY